MPADVLTLLTALGTWSQQHPGLVLSSMAGMTGLGLGTALLAGRHRRLAQDTHGSARWASRRDARQAGLFAEHGVVLGRLGRRVLRHDGEAHVLLCGPTRSGKGVSTIVPTLLTWPESVLVLDPKAGENYDITRQARLQYGPVHAFTPCGAPHCRINVLDLIRCCTPQEVGDAVCIAQSLTAPRKLARQDATSVHFQELANTLLTAVILHLCYTRAKQSLADAWAFLTQEHQSLHECLATLTKTAHTAHGGHPAIVDRARAIMNITGDRELSSVWSTAIRPLELYSDPLVARSTNHSDVNVLSLQYGQRPVSLYLIAPSPMALERLHPIYRVILDVAMPRLMEVKVRTWKHRLLNVLDELPWYGYCRAIDTGIAVQAGYGQKNLVVTQDLESLWETYGDRTPLWGNVGIKIFHTPSNDKTAKRISENLLGRATVPTQSTNHGRGLQRSVSEHAMGRPLLTTDEVLRLGSEQEIVQVAGQHPLLAQKCDYRTGRY